MEKRLRQRVRCEIEGNFKILGSGPVSPLNFTTAQDLSEGGLRFRSNHFFPLHQRFYFHLQIPKAARIETAAELAWIREIPQFHCFEAGARFVELSSEHKNLLHHFIFQQLPSA